MSTSYFYLAASLPMLFFDSKPAMPTDNFLKECQRLMVFKDYWEIYKALNIEGIEEPPKNPLLKYWVRFERSFRNELAWVRAVKANKDPADYMRAEKFVEPYLVDVVAEAVKAQDPLTAEKILDRARWQRLEDLILGHYFDVEFLIIYALKLKILERYQEIESTKGKAIFAEYKKLEIPALYRVTKNQ